MSCYRCNRRQALKVGVNFAAGLAVTSGLAGALSGCGGLEATHSATTSPGASITNSPTNLYTFDFLTYPQLKAIGGAVVVTVQAASGPTTVSIVRTGATAASTVSVFCTHQGCQLESYNSSAQNYSCPCHGAVFSVAGAAMSGPTSTPLPSYVSTVTSANIQVLIT